MAAIWDLFVKLSGDNSNYKQSMQESTAITQQFGTTFSTLDQKLGAALGFGAIGAGALAAANKFDQAYAQISKSTGATGEKLKGLESSFTEVYKHTAASSEDVATALSNLSARTGATGEQLEKLTLSTIKLAKTQREDVGTIVPLVTRAFGDWSISTDKQTAAMDFLRVASQQSGTSVSKLSETVVYAGAPLRALGYSFETATTLISKFEKEGVNTELVLGGMKTVLAKFAKEGVTDTATAWQDFVNKVHSGAITFQDLASSNGPYGVGVKRATDLYRAIVENRFQIDGMTESLKKLANDGGASLETFSSKVTKARHEIESFAGQHYQLIAAIGLGAPIVLGIGRAFAAAFGPAIPIIANLTYALGTGMAGALTAFEAGIATFAASAFAGILGAAVPAFLQKLQQKLDGFWSGAIGSFRVAMALAGFSQFAENYNFDGPIKPGPRPGPSAEQLGLTNEGAPKDAGSIAKGLDPKEIQKAFSALGIKDLKGDLDKAVAAFNELRASGKLTGTQMLEAAGHIQKLRTELKGLHAEVPTSNLPAQGPLLSQLFSLPTPDHTPGLGELPQLDRGKELLNDISAGFLNAYNKEVLFASELQIVTDAFHAFGLKTPAEIAASVEESKQNFEILKSSGLATAHDIDKAFVEYKLRQIELDHILGDTDDALYAQQKKNAEDTLRGLDGEHVALRAAVKDRYDLGREMEAMGHRTFDSIERGFSNMVETGKYSFDSLIKIGGQFAGDLVGIFEKTLFKPIEDKFAALMGQVFGGGSKAAGAAGNAASSGASGAGGIAGAVSGGAGGALGVVGAVASVGTLISSVIGNFQSAAMNKSLDVLVNHTLRIFNVVYQEQQEYWNFKSQLFNKMDDIWGAIRNGGGAGVKGSSGNSFYFYGTSIEDVVRELKNAGIIPA